MCNSPDQLAWDYKATKSERQGINSKWSEIAASLQYHLLGDFQRWFVFIFPVLTSTGHNTKITSTSKNVEIQIEEVTIRGIIDTRSDITVLNQTAFCGIATICG